MLLLITLIMVGIGSVMLINIYSIFSPFVENLGDIKNYNQAYYGAIGGIERAELVLKFHKGGFEGSGGWLDDINTTGGPSIDTDYKELFGVVGRGGNAMWREIHSMTTQSAIPAPGEGNIEVELQGTGGKVDPSREAIDESSNYNILSPETSQEFILYTDNTNNTGDFYTGNILSSKVNFNNKLDIIVRIPPKIFNNYGGSNTSLLNKSSDLDGDSIGNDIILNRSLFGDYKTGGNTEKFTIGPNISIDYSGSKIENDDTCIREDVINVALIHSGANISLDSDGNHIIQNRRNSSLLTPDAPLITIPEVFSDGYSLSGNLNNLETALTNTSPGNHLQNLHLKLSVVNYPKDSNGKLYPFLEYKLLLPSGINTSDRNFKVFSEAKVGRFNVRVFLQRPILKTTAAQDFTILF